jgi:hypothetical protein
MFAAYAKTSSMPFSAKVQGVLEHAELFQPLRNLLHCAAPFATIVTGSVQK